MGWCATTAYQIFSQSHYTFDDESHHLPMHFDYLVFHSRPQSFLPPAGVCHKIGNRNRNISSFLSLTPENPKHPTFDILV